MCCSMGSADVSGPVATVLHNRDMPTQASDEIVATSHLSVVIVGYGRRYRGIL
jgi:hypothetical protein